MFERFTEDARDVVRLAADEARELSHDRIGTEHILLAFGRRPDSPAAEALAALGADEAAVRAEVERAFPHGAEPRPSGQIPFSAEAKKSLELGLREALALGHNHISPEHLLLGLVRADAGGAAHVLAALGVDASTLREKLVDRMPEPGAGRRGPRPTLMRRRSRAEWVSAPAGTGWEYRVEHPAGITAEWLNALGSERWELVGSAPADLGGLIFKRQRLQVVRPVEPPAAESG
jgi:ATP-dependent Clp protease ATP-binding subunit ClpC